MRWTQEDIRLRAAAPAMLELLEDVAELLEGYADVRDGDMGRQQPNAAATLLARVMECIEKAGG